MPDKRRNLYLFEAIELRNEYDRHIGLVKKLLAVKSYQSNGEEEYYRGSVSKSLM